MRHRSGIERQNVFATGFDLPIAMIQLDDITPFQANQAALNLCTKILIF
ncbi:hypothetical protein [Sulfitobacter aestuariivivens]